MVLGGSQRSLFESDMWSLGAIIASKVNRVLLSFLANCTQSFFSPSSQSNPTKLIGEKLFLGFMWKGGKLHYYQNIRDFIADIQSPNSLFRQLSMGQPLFHEHLWDLTCQLLHMEPQKRLTAAKAFFHPFCQVACFLFLSFFLSFFRSFFLSFFSFTIFPFPELKSRKYLLDRI